MKQHALLTAMTLYEGDTLDLQTAASKAGISPDRLRLAVRRAGHSVPHESHDGTRVPLNAD